MLRPYNLEWEKGVHSKLMGNNKKDKNFRFAKYFKNSSTLIIAEFADEISLKEIWHSDLLKEYRKLHLKDRSQEIAACSICEINGTDPKTAQEIWRAIRENVQI